MNKKISYILILLLPSCSNLLGPKSHGYSLGDGHPDPIGNSEIIDVDSFTEWKYYRITEDSLFHVSHVWGGDWSNSSAWDIAFQRYHIKTNSGLSGSWNAGAYVDSLKKWNGTRFNELDEIEPEFNYLSDTTLNTFYDSYNHEWITGIANPSLETWVSIDINNDYSMTITNNKFIVRTSDGEEFYKIWMRNYSLEGITGNIALIYDFICRLDICGICGGSATSETECHD